MHTIKVLGKKNIVGAKTRLLVYPILPKLIFKAKRDIIVYVKKTRWGGGMVYAHDSRPPWLR